MTLFFFHKVAPVMLRRLPRSASRSQIQSISLSASIFFRLTEHNLLALAMREAIVSKGWSQASVTLFELLSPSDVRPSGSGVIVRIFESQVYHYLVSEPEDLLPISR